MVNYVEMCIYIFYNNLKGRGSTSEAIFFDIK